MAKVTETIKDADNLVRRVKVLIGSKDDKNGRRISKASTLERPIHKLTSELD